MMEINKVPVAMYHHPLALKVIRELSAMYLHFYVYAYLRKDGTPYYIGKGQGHRAQSKEHYIKPPKDKSRIIYLEKNLSDLGALAIERRMIKWYGRKDQGTGILRNRTDGGDGAAGLKWSTESKQRLSVARKGKSIGAMSTETKQKISIANTGIIRSEEFKEKLRKPKSAEMKEKLKKPKTPGLKRRPMSEETKEKLRKPRSEEVKQKIRIAQLGIPRGPMSEETKQKISIATTNKPKIKKYGNSK